MKREFAKRVAWRRVWRMSSWLIIAGCVAVVLFAVWWPMRDYVRIRRKDCCGKGCGCLFPAKEPVNKE